MSDLANAMQEASQIVSRFGAAPDSVFMSTSTFKTLIMTEMGYSAYEADAYIAAIPEDDNV